MLLSCLLSDVSEPSLKRIKSNPDVESSDVLSSCKAPASSLRAGKVSGMNLPQEYKLARVIEDIQVQTKYPSWNEHTHACKWYGVYCNQEGKVNKIDWKVCRLSGTLHLSHLPSSLLRCEMASNYLKGEIPLEELYDTTPKLYYLDLSGNKFGGAIDLNFVPARMKFFVLGNNVLKGNLHLSLLPLEAEEVFFQDNFFNGNLDLTSLPKNIKYLDLRNNKFSGVIDLSHIPTSLEGLLICGNAMLRGTVEIGTLPEQLRRMSFAYTNIDVIEDEGYAS